MKKSSIKIKNYEEIYPKSTDVQAKVKFNLFS